MKKGDFIQCQNTYKIAYTDKKKENIIYWY